MADKPEWLRMRQLLWPESPIEHLNWNLDEILSDNRQAVFVAARTEGGLAAVVEVSLRDVAEGCETSPVGYIEAWFVDEDVRGQKLGRKLLHAAEDWAREKGCSEMASDTWLENEVSIQAHQRIGYEEVERLVHFVKQL